MKPLKTENSQLNHGKHFENKSSSVMNWEREQERLNASNEP